MPNLTVTVNDQLSQDEALARVQNFIDQAKTQYSDQMTITQDQWDGYVGTFAGLAKGMSVSGTVTVNPGNVTVDMKLPFAATFFKGQIEQGIQNQLSQILN